jgi:hypothetical protein
MSKLHLGEISLYYVVHRSEVTYKPPIPDSSGVGSQTLKFLIHQGFGTANESAWQRTATAARTARVKDFILGAAERELRMFQKNWEIMSRDDE